jgi:hypothetical protein
MVAAFVLGQVVSEERERLGERSAAKDDLRAAAGHRIQGGEALEHTNRIVRAQHGDGRAQENPIGPAGNGREHDLGR